MKVCLLTDRPGHPTLSRFAELMDPVHTVAMFDPDTEGASSVGPADVYLLKSHSPRSLALASTLRGRGERVVNDPAAAALCRDRVAMARLARRHGLPFVDTASFGRLSGLLAHLAHLSTTVGVRFPVVVKSRYSRRGDVVTSVGDLARLRELTAGWAHEPVVLQPFVSHDGWDHKLWVIGGRAFATRRGSRLGTAPSPGAGLVPHGWRGLAVEVGRVFGLQVYGVDVLATNRGPVIVDINAFPGFRDVPAAPGALAALVEGMTAAPGPERTVADALRAVVRELVADKDSRRPDDRLGAVSARERYLRRKPGTGLVASYRVLREPRDRSHDPGIGGLVTARLTEKVLTEPSRLPDQLGSLTAADLDGTWPGVLHCRRFGLTVQRFPLDEYLPSLPTALSPHAGGQLARELRSGFRLLTGRPAPGIVAVYATPVRYKPGARCVIRYRIIEAPGPGPHPTVYGKIYREPGDAVTAHRLLEQLWRIGPGEHAFVPRPIALVGGLNLVLTAAAGTPAVARIGETALTASARALAWLHTRGVHSGLSGSTSGAAYANHVAEWTTALTTAAPLSTMDLGATVRGLPCALRDTVPESPGLVHGAFKPAQLVFPAPDRPVITDFDKARIGDPALDVGYFLAYLRPPELWRGCPEGHDWFAAAARPFLRGYADARRAHGMPRADVENLVRRSSLYEAAALLKIVSRPVRRLGTPGAAELATAVAEIGRCARRYGTGKDRWT
ncbi:phosphotransferase [Amycolatopsis sp. NPDC059021]|uniref:phosphotransferase n=1 Tax=Amycolatopsis sp. NPDC059021 TaxID=3346704 RepID=UPI003671178C